MAKRQLLLFYLIKLSKHMKKIWDIRDRSFFTGRRAATKWENRGSETCAPPTPLSFINEHLFNGEHFCTPPPPGIANTSNASC